MTPSSEEIEAALEVAIGAMEFAYSDDRVAAATTLRAHLSRLREEAARPRIVCLCGSSRFIDRMAVLAWEFEKEGYVALSLHLLPRWYTQHDDHQAEHEGIAEQMDALHLRKINMADEVFVVNVDGYIGDSTRREIAHATASGKPVKYLEARALEEPRDA